MGQINNTNMNGVYYDLVPEAFDNIASAYDDTNSYSVGDFVIYDYVLYKCITEIDTAEEWDASHWTAVKVTNSFADLNTALTQIDQSKADIIISSVSGDIASFADGADNLPVEDLTVGIEPVQDLHGYDNPWAPGGGKNLLPMVLADIKSANTDGTWTGNAYTLNGITFTVLTDSDDNVTGINLNGTAGSGGVTFYLLNNSNVTLNGTYKFWGDSAYEDRVMTISYLFSATQEIDVYDQTITQAVNDTLTEVHLYLWAGVVKSNVVIHPMFTLSTVSDATFAPYSNICPISGHTGMTVNRTAKNLLPAINYNTSAFTLDENGYYAQNNTSSASWSYSYSNSAARVKLQAGTYTVSFYASTVCTSNSGGIQVRDSENTLIASNGTTPVKNLTTLSFTFTLDKITEIGVCIKCYDGVWRLQIESGQESTATTYEPYSGTSIPIDWTTEAGTVYGGSLNVKTGVLTVDREYKSDTWGNGLYATDLGNNVRKLYLSTNTHRNVESVGNSLCNIAPFQYLYNYDSTHWYPEKNSKNIYLFLPENTDADTVVQFVCELATPQTYQLTPQEVKTLLGQNNIWGDTGDSSVTYRADTRLYVDGKVDDVRQDLSLIAPIENGSTASQAYSAGQYFLKDDKFCKALTSIASGATFTLNTNYSVTTVAAELYTALNS